MATPTVRKLQLGHMLRHLREQAGLTQEEAGKVIEKPQAKFTELENGKRGIGVGDLKLLLDAYGVSDPELIEFMMDLRRNNHQRGNWTGYRAIHPDQFRQYVEMEQDADLVRTVESEVPPGLLQSESFIRALYAERPELNEDDIENGVQARLLRQRVLHRENPLQAEFVISESSLLRWYGGPEIMREQIDHMIKLSRLGNVQIQVLPFETRANVAALVGFRFVLLRIPSPGTAGPLEFAYIEGVDTNRYLDDKKAVATYGHLWSRLTAAALSPSASREFMAEVAKRYR
ncbi:helix-turn-helix domain-containing protein [Goodfellowiella coeruleoviolacea]|uniref:Helix-turn-helix domain-containing protein n=1 Tax=Goodfellowiella coeruleoviolacea TaxID=334858 RepID=A0AAE3GAZ6_9PSEU|nr:helix-turn-helix transcriptional regulator [Goodfellowiella coeruleoviolacea]MCP2164926.1 Helix-turn-helix domain-containing protein [Goodfellowiella coeruleoviolacea]